jgi:hypothetical protein
MMAGGLMRALMSVLLLGCMGGRRAEPPAELPADPVDAPAETQPVEPARTDVKVSGNLPVRTEAELAAEAAARDTCLETCLRDRQAEARAIELIEADCQASCQHDHPIEQVELAPSLAPLGLPDG